MNFDRVLYTRDPVCVYNYSFRLFDSIDKFFEFIPFLEIIYVDLKMKQHEFV